jgi:hypothetical protein
MLSKPVGPTGFYALSSTTGTHYAATFSDTPGLTGDYQGNGPSQQLPATKVRVAVSGQPAVINFGNNKTANNNSDLLQPPGTVEHYKLESTTTVTFQLVGSGSNGYISITPVA